MTDIVFFIVSAFIGWAGIQALIHFRDFPGTGLNDSKRRVMTPNQILIEIIEGIIEELEGDIYKPLHHIDDAQCVICQRISGLKQQLIEETEE